MGVPYVGPAPSTPTDLVPKSYVDSFVGGYTNMEPGSMFVVDYNFGSSAYPARPTSRTDLVAVWRGPSAPQIGGGFALAGDAWWVKTS